MKLVRIGNIMQGNDIINYPINENGDLVTRRSGLTRMKPRLDAPPANQPGSVDWSMTMLFGSRETAVKMIESLVAGQGENADEKWVRFVLLYKQWTIQHEKGELEEAPTFNQVCHSLDFDTKTFISELQTSVQSLMKLMAQTKAALHAPQVVSNLILMATDPMADVKSIELALKLGGVMEDKAGMNVQINNTNQNAVILKGDKEKLKSPLRQFSQTVKNIDDAARDATHVTDGLD